MINSALTSNNDETFDEWSEAKNEVENSYNIWFNESILFYYKYGKKLFILNLFNPIKTITDNNIKIKYVD